MITKEQLERELVKQLRKTSFMDKEMVKLAYQQDVVVENEIVKAILKVGVDVDKERLEKWIQLCLKLEHIDESTQIDIAISKKFKELNDKIYQLKQEVEYYKTICEDLWEGRKCQNKDF